MRTADGRGPSGRGGEQEALRIAFRARGHPNIAASHPTTFEFTRETHVSRRGDCIVAVAAECGLAGLPPEMARAMRSPDARMTVRIRCGDAEDIIVGRGDPGLTYAHPTEMVGRCSGYTCGRTLLVRADRAARGLDRGLVEALRKGWGVEISLWVHPGNAYCMHSNLQCTKSGREQH